MAERFKTPELNVEYEIDYRNVKYPRLEYKTGSLLLILPKSYENKATFIEKHKKWIHKKEQIIKKALEEAKGENLDIARTKEELKSLIYSIIKTYQEELNIKINKIFFRKMKTKWGSYSSKRNLTINTLLKYLPKKLIEYVIFHEMAHSMERKHNERFWKTIGEKYEDFQTHEKDLLVYWFLVQKYIGD